MIKVSLSSLLVVFVSFQSLKAQWVQQTSSTAANLKDIYCTDANHCFTAGTTGNVRKTVNGGTNWIISSTSTFTDHACIKMYDTTKIWTGKINGTFHYSSNGGGTWSQVTPVTTSHVIYDIFFHDANNFIAIGGSSSNPTSGGNVTVISSNGGGSWTATNSSGVPTMFAIHCLDATTCLAAAGAETIYKTTDNGTTWNAKHSGTTANLYDISFPNSTVGYAAGGDPSANTSIVLKTTDGGDTWTTLSNLTAPNVIYGLHFTSVDTGYFVGKGGFIMKTEDGGATWGSQASPVTTDLNKVYFPATDTGYISGASGVILKTTNGGGMLTGTSEPQNENSIVILDDHNEITIKTNFSLKGTEVIVINTLGEKINMPKNIYDKSVLLNTSGFSKGIYFFRITTEKKTISGKFLTR